MAHTELNVVKKSSQETSEWLNDISEQLGQEDQQVAYHALRGVLFALRDRLTVEEAVQLSAQFPTFVRGIFFEGYQPAGKPLTYRGQDEFLERVEGELQEVHPADAEEATRAVFVVLDRQISSGEVEDVQQMLPDSILSLWPQEATEVS